MIARMISLLCAVGLAAPLWAQAGRTEEGTSGSYVGVIAGDRVNVRAGPDTGYIVTQVSAPTQVTVVGKVPGWLKILPPADTFGVVSKQYVTPDATGKVGTVSAGDVFVRAGGSRRQTEFDSILVRLNQGDKVEIQGEIGTFYKITPPAGSYFWIAEQYVRAVTDGAAPARPADGPARPVDGPARPTDTAPAEGTPARPPVRPPIDETALAPDAGQVAGLKEAEEAWKTEMAKPADQRDYQGLLDKYKALAVPATHSSATIVQGKISALENTLKYLREAEELRRTLSEIKKAGQQYEAERAEIAIRTPTTRAVVQRYAAQGVLAPSDIFPGTGAVPKRWIVRDRQTLRVDAYVQSTANAVDLNRYVGKHVGIQGKSVYDQALGLDIVEAEKIVVLEEAVQLPAPPKPILRSEPPQPKLAPVPPVDVPGLGKPGEKTPAPPVRPAIPPAPPAKTDAKPASPDDDLPIFKEPATAKPATPAAAPKAPTTQPATVLPVVPVVPVVPATPAAPAAPKAPATQPAKTAKPAPKPAAPAALPLN